MLHTPRVSAARHLLPMMIKVDQKTIATKSKAVQFPDEPPVRRDEPPNKAPGIEAQRGRIGLKLGQLDWAEFN